MTGFLKLTKEIDRIKKELYHLGLEKQANELEDVKFNLFFEKYAEAPTAESDRRHNSDNSLKRIDELLERSKGPVSIWLNPPHLGAIVEKKNDNEYHVELMETKSHSLDKSKYNKEKLENLLTNNPRWSPIHHI
jgi:hypothetical protein